MPPDSPFITVTDLGKVYGRPPAEVRVLTGVSLTIPAGASLAVLGKSGSGKSTLLNLLGGLDAPTSGRVEVAGRDLAAMTPGERADYRRATVGIIFQSFHLIPGRTALENVELPLYFAGASRRVRRRVAEEALDAVGLSHRLRHRPAELSGGERQRVAIARALVNRPRLLLADEPTGNLDSATGAEVIDLLTGHVRRARATLVLVTHDEELAGRVSDRVVRMHDGVLVG